VSIEAEVSSVSDPQRGGWVPVDAEGRYRRPGLPDGRFVKISSVVFWPPEARLCATTTITRGDTELDVNVYRTGAPLPPLIVSGQVFRMEAGRRVPVVGAELYFSTRAYGPDVVAGTDSNGVYTLCGLQSVPGRLGMFCGNDIQAYGREFIAQPNQVIDIDATSFYQCLWPYVRS
jgi:hypothetical protein